MGLEGNDLSSPGGMAVGQELGQGLDISAALHPLSMNTGLVLLSLPSDFKVPVGQLSLR